MDEVRSAEETEERGSGEVMEEIYRILSDVDLMLDDMDEEERERTLGELRDLRDHVISILGTRGEDY